MSESDKQHLYLIAIEHLKFQYEAAPVPFVALLIAKHYSLLAGFKMSQRHQEKYMLAARLWQARYLKNQRHSPKMQTALNDVIRFSELPFHSL